jgi:hypothetical protein
MEDITATELAHELGDPKPASGVRWLLLWA